MFLSVGRGGGLFWLVLPIFLSLGSFPRSVNAYGQDTQGTSKKTSMQSTDRVRRFLMRANPPLWSYTHAQGYLSRILFACCQPRQGKGPGNKVAHTIEEGMCDKMAPFTCSPTCSPPLPHPCHAPLQIVSYQDGDRQRVTAYFGANSFSSEYIVSETMSPFGFAWVLNGDT